MFWAEYSGGDVLKGHMIGTVDENGVGKSSVAKSLLTRQPKSAFVDSDWCRVINPFPFTDSTKETVTDNIYCLLRNYLQCKDIDYVIFTYGFHGERKAIFDENIRRMIEDGREENRIKRGIDNTFHFYDRYDYPTIDTTELEIDQVADRIAEIVGIREGYGKCQS